MASAKCSNPVVTSPRNKQCCINVLNLPKYVPKTCLCKGLLTGEAAEPAAFNFSMNKVWKNTTDQ